MPFNQVHIPLGPSHCLVVFSTHNQLAEDALCKMPDCFLHVYNQTLNISVVSLCFLFALRKDSLVGILWKSFPFL